MLNVLLARWQQGHRTIPLPLADAPMPDRFRGRPLLNRSKCPDECSACVDACPTDALTIHDQEWKLDLGRCLFCTDCAEACPEGAVTFSREYRLAARNRADLVIFWGSNPAESHPRHLTRYSTMPKGLFVPNGRKDRTVVVVDVRRSKSAPGR